LTPPASPMPPMGDLLDPSELRDLVAWLASLNTGGESPKTIGEPTLLDPTTLKITAGSGTSPSDTTSIDPAFLKTGKQQFIVCAACHGQGGEGTAAAPPLAGSEWVNGPEENLIRIQLRGLLGPIRVKGQEYNMPAGMAALAYQSDEQIAAVLTYVRSSFGNSAPAVSPAAVTELRGEVGKPQLASTDLTPLRPKESAVTDEPAIPNVTPGKYDQIPPPNSSPYFKYIALGMGLLIAVGLMRMKKK
jgi:quinoprotein glucose dehydrogenase